MDPGFLEIGRIVKPQGLRGQVKVWMDPGSGESLQAGRRVWLTGEAGSREYGIDEFKIQGRAGVLRLTGIQDRQSAEQLVGRAIQVRADALQELPAGEYYWHQMAGSRVVDEEGRFLGTLEKMFSTPAHDVWVARSEDQEYLIPAVAEVIVSVNREENEVRVRNLKAWWEVDGC